jgi:hypothetical protein
MVVSVAVVAVVVMVLVPSVVLLLGGFHAGHQLPPGRIQHRGNLSAC